MVILHPRPPSPWTKRWTNWHLTFTPSYTCIYIQYGYIMIYTYGYIYIYIYGYNEIYWYIEIDLRLCVLLAAGTGTWPLLPALFSRQNMAVRLRVARFAHCVAVWTPHWVPVCCVPRNLTGWWFKRLQTWVNLDHHFIWRWNIQNIWNHQPAMSILVSIFQSSTA